MPRTSSIALRTLGLALLVVVALVSFAHGQTVTFGGITALSTTNPVAVAAGDLNRDGRLDLVVVNGTPGTISVLLATGDGTFGTGTSFAVGGSPVAVALGDLNRDGILDAVVVNMGDGSVSILLGNGTGGFGSRTDIVVGARPTTVAIGDLDGDGRLDLVVANGLASSVTVLLGNGTGAFSLVGDFPTGSAPSAIALADVTGDNVLDVIVSNRGSGTVSVLAGTGTGNLGPRQDFAVGIGPSSVAVADVNGDGRPDIVVGNLAAGSVSVLLANTAGGLQPGATLPAGLAPLSVAIADLNGDGLLDLVLAGAAGVTVLAGDGTGGFGVPALFTTATTPGAAAVGDFDRDGIPDFVTANPGNNNVAFRLNTTAVAAAGRFVARSPIGPPSFISDPQPVAILLGDVASGTFGVPGFDGLLDLVVVDEDEVSIATNSRFGVNVQQTPFPSGGAFAAALADIDGDGRLDLVLGRSSGIVSILPGTRGSLFGPIGGGSFGPPIDVNVGFTPIAIGVGDLNRDGLPDLVVGIADFPLLLVVHAAPAGLFLQPSQLGLPQGALPRAVALADLNRDGILDLVVGHANGVSVFLGTGNVIGAFGSRSDPVTSVSVTALAVGDVNRDGRLDVVFASAEADSVSILLGDGAGNFVSPISVGNGFSTPIVVGLADLDRDGSLDLVVLNAGDQTVAVRFIAGGVSIGPPVTFDAGPDPVAFAIGDLDRDGRLDLAVLSADREVRVLLNDAPGAGTIAFVAGLTPPSIVEGAATAVVIARGGGTASVTVGLTVTGTAVLGVDYNLTDASSSLPVPASGTLTFAQGETRKTLFVVPPFASNNAVVEPDKSIVFTLSHPGGGATLGTPTQLSLTFTERDEALSFTQPIFAVSEGGQATVTVNRRGDLKGTVTVGFKLVAASASGSDVAAAAGTLTFGPGVAQQAFTVRANTDALREADETAVLTLSNPTSSVRDRVIRLESPSVAELAVVDRNGAVVSFASATAAVAEGTITNVVLTRTGALAETATATVGVTLLSASAADFTLLTPAPQTIVFAPGVTSQSIPITAVNDALAEGPETLRLDITSVTSGGRPSQIGSVSSVLVTIVDDEAAFGFTDPFANRQLPESATTATFTVVRSGPLTTTATVQARTVEGAGGGTAVPGLDYQPVAPTTLTFAAGVATQTFTVPLLNDTIVDGPKTLRVTLASPTGGLVLGSQAVSSVTLLDDDEGGTIQWQKAAATVAETGTATLMVTRVLSTPTRHLASGVTVDFAVTGGTALNGTDYTLAAGTLTFAAGQTSQSITVPIHADTLDEPDETVLVTLTNPQGGATLGPLVTTTLTITDDDAGGQIQFATGAATATEDNPAPFTIRITRTGSNLASAVTVDLAVAGGTAIQGVDFGLPTGTLTFGAGEGSKDLVLARANDGLAEGPETIVLALSNPKNGATLGVQRTMVVTLTGPENAVGFALPSFSTPESASTATITVLRTGSLAAAATVQVRTVDGLGGGSVALPGVDYLPVPPTTLTFPAGMASRTFTVPLLNNTRVDGARTVLLALGNPSAGLALGTQQTAVLTITDNDTAGTIGFTADTFTASESAGQATLTLTRTGTSLAGGISVDFIAKFLGTFGFETRRLSGTVVFGAGQSTKAIVLPLTVRPFVDQERVLVDLSNPTGGAALGRSRAQLVVTDKDAGGVVRFAASTVTVVEGSTALLTVVRTGGLAAGVSVPLGVAAGPFGTFSATSGVDFVLANGSVVVFNEGETSKTVAVPIPADALLEGPETFRVFLGNPSGGATLGTPSAVVVTILDGEAVVGFAQRFTNVDESATKATVTVLRSGPLTGSATVQFKTVEGTGGGNALPNIDYTPIPLTTLTFGPGVASQTITVSLLKDQVIDGQRTVVLVLSNPIGVALATSQPTTTVIIADNAFGGVIQFSSDRFFVSETAGVAVLRVTRVPPNISPPPPAPILGGGVTVDFVATGVTATSGADFTLASGRITFGFNETFKDIVIPLVADGVSEGPETVVVTLQNPSGGFGSALGLNRTTTLTIVD